MTPRLSIFKRFFQSNKKPEQNLKPKQKKHSAALVRLQSLGKALIYPIAVLPFAALLNRLGALGVQVATEAGHYHQVDWWIATIVQTPGLTVFNNLPILFACGVGFGLSKDNRGEAALVGILLYLILAAFTAEGSIPSLFYNNVLTFKNSANGELYSKLFYLPTVNPTTGQIVGQKYILDVGVLGGITSGGFAAYFYNKFKNLELPEVLSFFGGRRFVPMIIMLFSVPMCFMFAVVWPWLQYVLVLFGTAISSSNEIAIPGAFAYGVINRLMQPFGLHHILNTFLWFQLPIHGTEVSFNGKILMENVTVNGDINAFNRGVAQAGVFQSGYFPVFMGAEPGMALAMILAAPKGVKRNQVAGFLGGVGAIAFLTGIDEPLVFSFIFVSPLLWGVYAFYTGISNAIVTAFHIHLGFGFSAGLIDYIISFPQSWGNSIFYGTTNGATAQLFANPLWIFPISLFMLVLSFFTFLPIIKKMDVKTPGREGDNMAIARPGFEAPAPTKPVKVKKPKRSEIYARQAKAIYKAVGGFDNIETIANCATRLRLTVKDNIKPVNDREIKANGGASIIRLGTTGLQIVIGVQVESYVRVFEEEYKHDEIIKKNIQKQNKNK